MTVGEPHHAVPSARRPRAAAVDPRGLGAAAGGRSDHGRPPGAMILGVTLLHGSTVWAH